MQEVLNGPNKGPAQTAMPANATEAALRVVQSVLLSVSRMPVTAVERACSVEAPPA